MSRTKTADRYIARINLTSGSDVRRFCEVHIDDSDDVYVFQPRKGGSVKVSYHESGQRHLKIGSGPAMFVMHSSRPEWIRTEERLWSKSFENFASLAIGCGGYDRVCPGQCRSILRSRGMDDGWCQASDVKAEDSLRSGISFAAPPVYSCTETEPRRRRPHNKRLNPTVPHGAGR